MRNHGLCGHSEEWPRFKPLFAMTNRKSYQRTISTIIHLNAIFINSPTRKQGCQIRAQLSKIAYGLRDSLVAGRSIKKPMNNNVLTYSEYQKRLKELKTPEDIASFAQELIAPALAGNMTPEKKRDTAEEKLFAGLISDDDFTRIKVKIKEQVENIQDEIYAQDKKLNMRIDELQDILLFVRNAYEAYMKAPNEMKRLFLGLYWERFEVTDKKAVTVIPSPIIRALMQAEGLIFTEKYKESQMPRIVTDTAVEFTPVITGKSKPLVAPKTQKSRRNAEIPVMVSNEPSAVILDTVWGA